MNKKIIIASALLLVGCGPVPQEDRKESVQIVDQEVRRSVFMECLDRAPAGPVSTRYNDWDEVVSECSSAAYHIAIQGPGILPAMRADSPVEK